MFQLQAQNISKTKGTPQLTSGPAILTNDPPCTNQSVETMTLKGHSLKADEYLLRLSRSLSPSQRHAHTFPFPPHPHKEGYLYPSLSWAPRAPFLCLCNLFPNPISSTSHFFYLCDFLNKLSLIVWVFALNSQQELKCQGCWTKVQSDSTGLTPGAVLATNV